MVMEESEPGFAPEGPTKAELQAMSDALHAVPPTPAELEKLAAGMDIGSDKAVGPMACGWCGSMVPGQHGTVECPASVAGYIPKASGRSDDGRELAQLYRKMLAEQLSKIGMLETELRLACEALRPIDLPSEEGFRDLAADVAWVVDQVVKLRKELRSNG
jgi:hypothetical protein